MLKITGLKLPLGFREGDLKRAAAKQLRLPESAIGQVRLCKKSVDARKKDNVHFVCAVEAAIRGTRTGSSSAAGTTPCKRRSPTAISRPRLASCPSGRWWWALAGRGCSPPCCWPSAARSPIVLERGQAVEERERAVQRF